MGVFHLCGRDDDEVLHPHCFHTVSYVIMINGCEVRINEGNTSIKFYTQHDFFKLLLHSGQSHPYILLKNVIVNSIKN